MPTIVQRVRNAHAQGTRWRATPNAHQQKDQTVKISEKREQGTSPEWLTFTAVNRITFKALQTKRSHLSRVGRSEYSTKGRKKIAASCNNNSAEHTYPSAPYMERRLPEALLDLCEREPSGRSWDARLRKTLAVFFNTHYVRGSALDMIGVWQAMTL